MTFTSRMSDIRSDPIWTEETVAAGEHLPADPSHRAIKKKKKTRKEEHSWSYLSRANEEQLQQRQQWPPEASSHHVPAGSSEKRVEVPVALQDPPDGQPCWNTPVNSHTGYLRPSKVSRPLVALVYSHGCRFTGGGWVIPLVGGPTAQTPPMGRVSGFFNPSKPFVFPS